MPRIIRTSIVVEDLALHEVLTGSFQIAHSAKAMDLLAHFCLLFDAIGCFLVIIEGLSRIQAIIVFIADVD